MKKYILYLFLLFPGFSALASHIVGAELFYDYLGGNNFRITLRLYRNCGCTGCADYSLTEYVQIFDSLGNYVDSIPMTLPPRDTIPQVVTPCQNPIDVCIEQAFFTGTRNFPPMAMTKNFVSLTCIKAGTSLIRKLDYL